MQTLLKVSQLLHNLRRVHCEASFIPGEPPGVFQGHARLI